MTNENDVLDTLKDAFCGPRKEESTKEPCFSCNGTGLTSHWDCPEGFPCNNCKGTGYTTPEVNQAAKDVWNSWCDGMKKCDDGEESIKLAENIRKKGYPSGLLDE